MGLLLIVQLHLVLFGESDVNPATDGISMALSGEGVLSNYDWPDFISLEIKFVASYWVD